MTSTSTPRTTMVPSRGAWWPLRERITTAVGGRLSATRSMSRVARWASTAVDRRILTATPPITAIAGRSGAARTASTSRTGPSALGRTTSGAGGSTPDKLGPLGRPLLKDLSAAFAVSGQVQRGEHRVGQRPARAARAGWAPPLAYQRGRRRGQCRGPVGPGGGTIGPFGTAQLDLGWYPQPRPVIGAE